MENNLNRDESNSYSEGTFDSSHETSENHFQANNFSEPPHNNYSYEAPYQNNQQYFLKQEQNNFGICANYSLQNQNTDFSKIELNKMRSVSAATISIFICWAVLLILIVVLVISINVYTSSEAIKPFVSYPSASKTSLGPTINPAQVLLALNTALTCFETIFGIFWALGLLTCGVVGTIRAWELSKKSQFFFVIMIVYIIGIFLPPFQVIAAFMSLSKIKEHSYFTAPT